MRKVAFFTLGCKVNQYETQAISECFLKEGYSIVSFDDFADVYLVNTCTVTGVSDKKSRQMLRRAKEKNPNAVTVASGCYAQTNANELVKIGVDLVVGTDKRNQITALVDEIIKKTSKKTMVEDISKISDFEEMTVDHYEGRTRAYIKIQEGCNNFCSYCIIPYARGRVRSRKINAIVQEANRLALAGYSEIVLTGIEVASYGKDLDGISLIDVIEKVHETPNLLRLRLSSIDPRIFSPMFIDRLALLPKVCPHFHISLQSGCDETLMRMNRHYSVEDFRKVVNLLREKIKNVAITTDIITGFPGESDEEYLKTKGFVKEIGFSKIHVFPFSEREGTIAATMKGKIPKKIRVQRAKEIAQIGEESKKSFENSLIGQVLDVLFENNTSGYTGNYIRVNVVNDSEIEKKILPVLITGRENDDLIGALV